MLRLVRKEQGPVELLMPVGIEDLIAKEMLTFPVRQAPKYSAVKDNLNLLDRQVLAAYIEAWVDLKFKAVPDNYSLDFGREQDGVLSAVRRNLQSKGYLVVEEKTHALEPSSKALSLYPIWTSSQLTISMNGLAKQIQPNSEFTLIHANARNSFLTALSMAQAYGDVTLKDLSRILSWTYEDTIFWAKDLKKFELISAALKGESYVFTTKYTTKSISSLSALRVPAATLKQRVAPEMARILIPDLIYHLCKSAGFSKGLTSGELAKAFLTQGYTANPAHHLIPLVDQGILKVEEVSPLKGNLELGRLNQATKLYSLADPNFMPSRSDYDLKDLPQNLMGSRATGIFRCKRAGLESSISTEEIYRVALSLSQQTFALVSLKAKLAEQSIHIARTALEVILETMISTNMLSRGNFEPQNTAGKRSAKFVYQLIERSEKAAGLAT